MDIDNRTLQAFNNLYLGLGIGAIENKLTKVTRINSNGKPFLGANKSIDLLVPVSLGLAIPIKNMDDESRFSLLVNYQCNFTFGEGLDGYNDPKNKINNKSPDIFTVLSIGLKYIFRQEVYR